MKSITVRLPEVLLKELESESRTRGISKSDVIRERLQARKSSRKRKSNLYEAIRHLIGSIDGLPSDLSARTEWYLKAGYGKNAHR